VERPRANCTACAKGDAAFQAPRRVKFDTPAAAIGHNCRRSGPFGYASDNFCRAVHRRRRGCCDSTARMTKSQHAPFRGSPSSARRGSRSRPAFTRPQPAGFRLGGARRGHRGQRSGSARRSVAWATLLYLGALQWALQSLLGVRVELVTPGDLPSRFRDDVLREAVPL
jgi:hypothetical protein